MANWTTTLANWTNDQEVIASRIGNRTIFARLGGLGLVLVGWQLLSLAFNPNQFPGLGLLAANVYEVVSGSGRYDPIANYGITIARILLGFGAAMTVGTTVGILMGTNKFLDEYLTTPVMIFMSFPALIWAFLGVLWFGLTTYLVPAFTIFMIVTPYVIVNVWEGAKDVDAELVEMATTFDASTAQVWQEVYLPHLRPYLLSTTRIAFSLSWKISLVAEIFGTTSGVGLIVDYYYQTFQADMIIAWALPIMVLIFGAERLLRMYEQRLFEWRPATESETMEEPGV